jgi:hypothetical protein
MQNKFFLAIAETGLDADTLSALLTKRVIYYSVRQDEEIN